MSGLSIKPSATWIITAASFAFLLKLILAATTYGTNDMLFYEGYSRKLQEPGGGIALYQQGINLRDNAGRVYRHEEWMNPPFVINILNLVGGIASATGSSFAFWMRVPSILADLGIVALLWLLGAPRPALLVVALSPVSLLISGFHGSTDALMICLLLLSLYLFQRTGNPLLAGLALGMSINIKVWPALLVPAVLFWLPDLRHRALFITGTGLTFAVGSAPYLYQAPAIVIDRVFGYSSVYGNWGASRVFSWFSAATGVEIMNTLYRATGKYIVIAALAYGGYWLQKRYPTSPLPLRIGLLSALFLLITPGFGVQYLVWVAPWGALIGAEVLMLFSFSAAVFLVSVYNYWSGGFPWQVANSLNKTPWSGVTVGYEMLCWASILVLFLQLKKRLQEYGLEPVLESTPTPAGKPRRSKATARR